MKSVIISDSIQRVFLALVLLSQLAGHGLFAQQIQRKVIASGGYSGAGGGIHLSSTLGEAVVTTQYGADRVLTQGFQQGEDCTLAIATTGSDLACHGDTVGTASITINGGNPPYSILWSNGETGVQLSNLPVGTYYVTITDAAGCTLESMAEVTQPPALLIALDTIFEASAGQNNGAIEVSVAGGSPPYQFSWTGPDGFSSSDEDLSQVPSGVFSLSITDVNGCTAEQVFEVDEITATREPLWASVLRYGPNPAKDKLWVALPPQMLSDAEIALFDGTGRLLPLPFSKTGQHWVWELKDQASRLILIRIKWQGEEVSRKVLKID